MSFGEVWWLLALPGIAVVCALAWAWSRALRQRQASLGAASPHLLNTRSTWMVSARRLTWLAGFLLLGLALAQPRWGEQDIERVGRGANIALLIDCSRSMLADDLAPSRMEVARRKAMDLMAAAPGHRVAIMPFAAIAVLRCPLTGDRHAVEDMLSDLSPELFPADQNLQGTGIGNAVRSAVDVLSNKGDRGRAIVILSDGSDPNQEAVGKAAERARSAGIPVYGLFLGDSERAPKITIDGRSEVMQAERDTLDELATRTGAISVSVSTDRSDVGLIAQHIDDNVTLLPWEERTRTMAAQRYQLALIPAIALLAGAVFIPTRRPRQREDR